VIPYLKLIRPLNLAIITLTLFFIKYGFLQRFELPLALNNVWFTILVIATVFTAAAGYVINDIQDIDIDTINKPNRVIVGNTISEKAAFQFYIILNVLGVVGGGIVANHIDKPSLAIIFIIASASLYWYASSLKRVLVGGNLLVSILVALNVLLIVLFDIFPVLNTTENRNSYLLFSKVILYFAIVAFYLNLIREIVKDLQDMNGDKNGGVKSLPIVLGRSRTTLVVFTMGVFALLILLLFCYYQLYDSSMLLAYFIFILGGGLLVFCIRSWNASTKKEYAFLSKLLKGIMFAGICSILLIHKLFL